MSYEDVNVSNKAVTNKTEYITKSGETLNRATGKVVCQLVASPIFINKSVTRLVHCINNN